MATVSPCPLDPSSCSNSGRSLLSILKTLKRGHKSTSSAGFLSWTNWILPPKAKDQLLSPSPLLSLLLFWTQTIQLSDSGQQINIAAPVLHFPLVPDGSLPATFSAPLHPSVLFIFPFHCQSRRTLSHLVQSSQVRQTDSGWSHITDEACSSRLNSNALCCCQRLSQSRHSPHLKQICPISQF